MRNATRVSWVRQRWVRPLVDATMAFTYLLQMAPYQTGGWYHELAGIAFVALLAVHHVLNARWLRSELRRRDWLPLLLDAMLLVCVAGIAVSGVLMAHHVKLLPFGGVAHVVRPVHAFLTYLGLMLVSVHAGMHLPLRAFNKLKPATRGALAGIVLALGGYAFVSLGVATKLSLGMSFPDGMTPLPVLVAKHLLLVGPFVMFGMMVERVRKRKVRT